MLFSLALHSSVCYPMVKNCGIDYFKKWSENFPDLNPIDHIIKKTALTGLNKKLKLFLELQLLLF